MANYRVAVVGCGHRSRPHILASGAIDGVEVVACCAPTPTRREKLAAEFGIAAYADAGEMIRKERPDMVHLVTWPDIRVELMTLVAQLSVPLCTVEKPIATGVRDWRALCRLEAESRTRFAVSHQCRWYANLTDCRQAVAGGRLGRPLFLDVSAGMNISGQGTHALNYGTSLIGDPKVVRVFGSACGWDARDKGHPAPETTEAYLTFDNGVRGLWTSGAVAPRCGDPNTTWQHVRAGVFCQHGRVEWQQFGRWEIVTRRGAESGDFGGLETWQQKDIVAQTAFHQAMLDWFVDESKPPGTNLRQSLHEWAVVLALYQSALERRPIEMDKFDPPDDLVERYRRAVG